MNQNRTPSILQRVPVILAVTAASYGLSLQAHAARVGTAPATSSTSTTAKVAQALH